MHVFVAFEDVMNMSKSCKYHQVCFVHRKLLQKMV